MSLLPYGGAYLRSRPLADRRGSVVGISTFVDQQFRADVLHALQGDTVLTVDVATSTWSLANHLHLLDHAVAGRTYQAPPERTFLGSRAKALMCDGFRSHLSQEVTSVLKRGVETPVATWLATECRPHNQDDQPDSAAELRQLVDAELISQGLPGGVFLYREADSLRRGLLVLERWLQGEA